jgi:hypothetical protein
MSDTFSEREAGGEKKSQSESQVSLMQRFYAL